MMIRSLVAALALSAFTATGAAAQEGPFSAGSTANTKWNVLGKETALFKGKVVDILCELSGDCPANCGDGSRQLGIIREADGVLVLVNKNSQAAFTGAVEDLLPYCGKDVEVDGLLAGIPEMTPAKFYQLQKIRLVGEEKFAKANKWTKVWGVKYPEEKKIKGPWFRKDPRVNSRIEQNGRLGLGKEADEAFAKENF